MTFSPTPEQAAIVTAASSTEDNLLINALAGAAKTSTLELIAKAVTGIPILSLAFNKKIAVEMEKRLPGHVKCATLNSLGHNVWSQALGRRQMRVNAKKTYDLFTEKVKSLPRKSQTDYYDEMGDILNLVRQMKISGFIPDTKPYPHATSLLSPTAFYDSLEETPSRFTQSVAEEILMNSIREAYQGHIDFDDQIYMPTLFGGTWPRFPLVLVDEAQDLSRLNHAMLKKLVNKRLIAVGDPYQSIYGFRGAIHSGMQELKRTFSMREMTLSISFRCPRSIILRANKRVPHMKWAETAIEGKVETLEHWTASDIPDGAAIICRNNAPLFKLALALIMAGRGINLVGADIGPNLIKVLKKLGPETMSREQLYVAINRWESEQLTKAKGRASVEDRAECLRVFASSGETLGAAIRYAEHLFASKGPIQLLSGHKSKGLEWDTVYHLDPWRIPTQYAETPEEHEQELNIRYVIETRSKKELYLVEMEKFSG